MLHNAAVVALGSFCLLLLAYFTYGRFLARRIFGLDPHRPTPAHTKEDGIDYVPTRVPVLFGHHFASIAGLGPILGPAIAVIWGWLPAVLWVVFGCMLIGAVHDLGALTVSLRYRGRSIGDVCQDLIGTRARLLFLVIIFFLMSLAMGAFVNAIASLFISFNPDAIIPSFGLMLVAMAVGVAVYRLRVGLGPATVVGLCLFAALIVLGVEFPVTTYEGFLSEPTQALLDEGKQQEAFASPYGSIDAVRYLTSVNQPDAAAEVNAAAGEARNYWIYALLAYGFAASVLPVWLLLQPRDYINSFQLYVVLAMLVIGLVVALATGAQENFINAPMVRMADEFDAADAPPPMFPFLFVIIACGAVSGFHSLVSSGTTVRQLNRETDALPIGFGGMLTEGALAVLVIMACVAGLGAAAWQPGGEYSSWSGISGGGLAVQLNAVVRGGANFMALLGMPLKYAMAFLAVTIVAFALTTLDSATRLLRFNVEEICRSLGVYCNRYLASLAAVTGIGAFGLSSGGKTLWVLFGTTNQLLAALTLLTVSLFLFKLGRTIWFTLLPMLMMLGMTVWAMSISLRGFWTPPEGEPRPWLLIGVSVGVMILTGWLILEGVLSFARGRHKLDFGDDDLPEKDRFHQMDEVTSSTHLG